MRSQFEAFLTAQGDRRSSSLSPQEREALFSEFLKWQRK
jgi:hypothetical protein